MTIIILIIIIASDIYRPIRELRPVVQFIPSSPIKEQKKSTSASVPSFIPLYRPALTFVPASQLDAGLNV